MPRHKQVTTCRKYGGPRSDRCSCEHCCLAVCAVCGASEGSLTTDCPGEIVNHARQQEVYETNLDYVDARGWHLAQTDDGMPIASRSPRFENTKLPPEPPRADSRAVVAPSIDWALVDRMMTLQHVLSQKAFAWVLADRGADEHAATITRIEDEIDAQMPKGKEDKEPNKQAQELLKTLEYERVDFRLASQRSEKCDDEFRQAARTLVTTLEDAQVATATNDEMLFTRTCGCTVVAGTACPHFVAARQT